MILQENSILRFLPIEINKRDLLVLDSIRFTLEMIEGSWGQLNEQLLTLSIGNQKKDLPAVFINVWNIFDNVQRFIKLYELLPSTSKHNVLNSIRKVRDIRNTFAHLDERIDSLLIETNTPFYGALTWEYRNDDTKKIEGLIAISGIHYGTKHNCTHSNYDEANKIVFNIQLETVDRQNKLEINIDELIILLIEVVSNIENSIELITKENNFSRRSWEKIRDITIKLQNN
jgi:hypothetical protein